MDIFITNHVSFYFILTNLFLGFRCSACDIELTPNNSVFENNKLWCPNHLPSFTIISNFNTATLSGTQIAFRFLEQPSPKQVGANIIRPETKIVFDTIRNFDVTISLSVAVQREFVLFLI